jgi:hypothetical protein
VALSRLTVAQAAWRANPDWGGLIGSHRTYELVLDGSVICRVEGTPNPLLKPARLQIDAGDRQWVLRQDHRLFSRLLIEDATAGTDVGRVAKRSRVWSGVQLADGRRFQLSRPHRSLVWTMAAGGGQVVSIHGPHREEQGTVRVVEWGPAIEEHDDAVALCGLCLSIGLLNEAEEPSGA